MSNDADPTAKDGGYAVLTATFLLGTTSALIGLDRTGKLPRRIELGDLALLGVATYQLSRTITRDRVTAFMRRPVARETGPAGRGEVRSEPRGGGTRKALGELAICPFCMTQWVALGLVISLCVAPRATRFAAGVLTVRTVAEIINLGHEAAVAEIDRLDDVTSLGHERAVTAGVA
jgi:hypothetical protein